MSKKFKTNYGTAETSAKGQALKKRIAKRDVRGDRPKGFMGHMPYGKD